MTAAFDELGLRAVTVKLAPLPPIGMVTLAGTVATVASELDEVTVNGVPRAPSNVRRPEAVGLV